MNRPGTPLLQLLNSLHHGLFSSGFDAIPFSDPVLIFGAVMTLLLLAPLAAKKLHLPEIVGLITAGIIFGPHGLGILANDQTITLLGKVGLLYIMFLAGLEIDLQQIQESRKEALQFGMLTFFLPLTIGTVFGLSIGLAPAPAVLLASMFSSHTLLSMPSAGRLGLTKHRAVTATVGGTIITDTLALLVLAVITGAAGGELSWLFITVLLFSIALYTLLTAVILPLAAKFFFQRVAMDENSEFIFVLAATFMIAYGAHVAGLEPIIGAFMAGLLLNRLIPAKSLLMTRIHFAGEAIFIPFFLLSVGMLVNPSLFIENGRTMVIALGMTVVALISKYAAARLFGWSAGYSKLESSLVYGLSVSQAAATLAAVLIGYRLNIFSEEIVTGTILMIAVTCLISSLITHYSGLKIAAGIQLSENSFSGQESRILIPMSSRAGAKELLDTAFLLRDDIGNTPLYPLHVVLEEGQIEQKLIRAEEILYHSVVRALAAKVSVLPITAVSTNTAEGILRAARDNRISTVLLDWPENSKNRPGKYGKTVAYLLANSGRQFCINRLVHPPATAARIYVIVPPMVERHPGLPAAFTLVKRLSLQASAPLTVLHAGNEDLDCAGFLNRIPPKTEVVFKPYQKIEQLLSPDFLQVKTDDWIFIIGSRRGELGWRPKIEQLPHRLLDLFPGNNLSVLFPGNRQDSTADFQNPRTVLPLQLGPEQQTPFPLYTIHASTPEQAIMNLTVRHFSDSDICRSVSEELTKIATESPVELKDHVILLHTSHECISHQAVFAGILTESVDFPGALSPVHQIIVLLGHPGQPPEQHLQKLAEIAAWVAATEGTDEIIFPKEPF